MKKIFALIFVAAIFATPLFSKQDDQLDNFPFEEEPLTEEATPYFVLGGGVTYNFNFINIDELNKQLNSSGWIKDDLKTPLNLIGGHGFTGLPWVKNLRLGLFSYGGSTQSDKITDTLNFASQSSYYMNMTGLSFDYGIVLFKNFAILPGVSLGWGYQQIENTRVGGEADWIEISPNNQNSYSKLEKGYLFVQPNIYFEYAVSSWLMVRANAGFNVTFDNFISSNSDWVYNEIGTAKNIPTGVNVNGAFAQIGFFVGLFNY